MGYYSRFCELTCLIVRLAIEAHLALLKGAFHFSSSAKITDNDMLLHHGVCCKKPVCNTMLLSLDGWLSFVNLQTHFLLL